MRPPDPDVPAGRSIVLSRRLECERIARAAHAGDSRRRSTIRAWLRTPDPARARSARRRASGHPGLAPSAALAAERVAGIIAAAEETAERMRLETEERVKARIAEAQRAADNRVRAGEEEASEAVQLAQAEATRLRSEANAAAEAATTAATSEALGIVARAEDSASQIVGRRASPRIHAARGRGAGSRPARRRPRHRGRRPFRRSRGRVEPPRDEQLAARQRGAPARRRPARPLVADGPDRPGRTRAPESVSGRPPRGGVVAASCPWTATRSPATTGSTCRSSSRRADVPARTFLPQSDACPSDAHVNICS